MTISNTVLYLFTLYFLIRPLVSLFRNYRNARKTGLSIIVSPLTPYTWQWQAAVTIFGSLLHSFRWFRAIDWTCAWHDEDGLHNNLGQSFILVSPGLNVICTSDPMTIEHVLRKWRDFVKPDNVNEILGTFGQNVDTSNGNDWTRHRKLTAPCFSERASTTVWEQAIEQSDSLIAKWLSSSKRETSSMIQDTSTLALNVISAVAFENHEVNKPAAGHTLSLRESLVTVMSTAISPAMEGIMPWLRYSGLQILLPKQVQGLLLAMREFRQYMDETISREREKPIQENEKLNLIRTLIKANDAARTEGAGTQARLSDVELRGNIFIFTVGGLESTAITLSYSLALLAVNPQIQDWVVEEVNDVLESEDVGYTKVFPKLKRIMAVMYETLRIYGPSPPLPRAHVATNTSYTVPTTKHNTDTSGLKEAASITLPGDTQIMLNSWACQSSPTYFQNPKIWDPKRWLDADGGLLHPTSESGFYAWGSGPRICPGMKFSQVEYTAVLASVLKRVKVRLFADAVEGDDAWYQEKESVMAVLRDSCADPLLLHVRRPEALRLKMVAR